MTRAAPAASAAKGLHSLLDAALERDGASGWVYTPAQLGVLTYEAFGGSTAGVLGRDTDAIDLPTADALELRLSATPSVSECGGGFLTSAAPTAAVSKGLDDALHAVTAALRSSSLSDRGGSSKGRASGLYAAACAAEERAYAALRRSERARGDAKRIRSLLEAERAVDLRERAHDVRSAETHTDVFAAWSSEYVKQQQPPVPEVAKGSGVSHVHSGPQQQRSMANQKPPELQGPEQPVSADGRLPEHSRVFVAEDASPPFARRVHRNNPPARGIHALQRRAARAAWDSGDSD